MELIYVITEMRHETEIYRFSISFEFDGSGWRFRSCQLYPRGEYGVPFGLVNLAENGRIRGILWGGNSVAATAGVKFAVNNLYSILSIG